jgi:hypothetical protein
MIVNLFPRNKYPSSVAGKSFTPRDRAKLQALLGSATEIWVHTRVYARDANVYLDFDLQHGCLGDEPPLDGLRGFSLTKSNTSPVMPYDTTTMAILPDDGVFSVSPKMGLVDVQAKVYNAGGSIEFESWATLIFQQ